MRRLLPALAAAGLLIPQAADGHAGCHSRKCERRVIAKHWTHEQRMLSPGMKALLARLRGCETRGIPFPLNYRYDGHHDGAYQYDAATWAEAGGRGFAWQASPAEQDVRTARFFPSHRGRWACHA